MCNALSNVVYLLFSHYPVFLSRVDSNTKLQSIISSKNTHTHTYTHWSVELHFHWCTWIWPGLNLWLKQNSVLRPPINSTLILLIIFLTSLYNQSKLITNLNITTNSLKPYRKGLYICYERGTYYTPITLVCWCTYLK